MADKPKIISFNTPSYAVYSRKDEKEIQDPKALLVSDDLFKYGKLQQIICSALYNAGKLPDEMFPIDGMVCVRVWEKWTDEERCMLDIIGEFDKVTDLLHEMQTTGHCDSCNHELEDGISYAVYITSVSFTHGILDTNDHLYSYRFEFHKPTKKRKTKSNTDTEKDNDIS